MDVIQLIALSETLRTGICLFCASVLLTRRRDKVLFRPLGLLFLSQGLTEVPGLIVPSPLTDMEFAVTHYLEVAVMIPDVASPFLLWWYVWELTTEEENRRIPHKWRHFVPFAVGLVLIGLFLLITPSTLQSDIDFSGAIACQVVVGIGAFVALHLLMACLVIVYLTMIIRRLRAHRTRLKDIFASTEDRELRWIWLIVLWSVLYVLFDTAEMLSSWFNLTTTPEQAFRLELIEELALIGLIWIIGVWGLRQRPVFARSTTPNHNNGKETQQPKYERSVLDDARATRIAAKIKSAMQNDLMYREPNLSLFDLSKHIGVSSHNVSQTLNTKMQATFFDYINGWRIKEAQKQLTTTDRTVLEIAYDVGFNSRSSFYKAFKRETGKTPMDLRK